MLTVFRIDARRIQKYSESIIEYVLIAGWVVPWLLTLVLSAWDATRSHDSPQSVLYNHIACGYVVIAIGALCLALTMLDIGTYRPRLFALCTGSAVAFFAKMATFSESLRKELGLIMNAAPSGWSDVKELEEHLLDEAHQFVLVDELRIRITGRILLRMAALVASLALIGYGLSSVTRGGLIISAMHGMPVRGAGLPEHIYFTVATFFTIGFGDLYPAHDAIGYMFLTVTIGTFTAIVYFVLTDLVASQSEFRANIKNAAASYVLQSSGL